MFTVTLKGKADPKRPDSVKITMVIYKPGFPRVTKLLNVTGHLKNWDQKHQRFQLKTQDAPVNNALLAKTVNQYIQVGNTWDDLGLKWTPVELSHYFDKPREVILKENHIPTVEQLFLKKIEELNEQKKIKNGHEITSSSYAKSFERHIRFMKRFMKEHYNRSFSTLTFGEITESFMHDYVFYIESEGAKKGNKGGLRQKLSHLYEIVKKATKKGIPGADLEVFECTAEKFREQETTPSTVSMSVIRQMENMDRSLLTKTEQFHLDAFLFCFYCGGMAPIDAAYLTWPCIDMKKRKVTYERMKTTKKGRPPFLPPAEKIAMKYRGKCEGEFVLPIFTNKQQTQSTRKSRMNYMCKEVNKTLHRIKDLLGFEEEITWYSCRGTYITMMLDRKYDPGVVAEHCGNSVQTIYKHYFKNLKERDIIEELCLEFAA